MFDGTARLSIHGTEQQVWVLDRVKVPVNTYQFWGLEALDQPTVANWYLRAVYLSTPYRVQTRGEHPNIEAIRLV